MAIPYHKHDINLLIEAVEYNISNSQSLKDTKDFISEQGINTDISIENSQLYEFNTIFSQALVKLNSIPVLQQKIKKYWISDKPFHTLINFISGYQSPMAKNYPEQMTNIEKLTLDYFYQYQTGDYFQRDFLFGTPSQKR
jgi:hypothetical protein